MDGVRRRPRANNGAAGENPPQAPNRLADVGLRQAGIAEQHDLVVPAKTIALRDRPLG